VGAGSDLSETFVPDLRHREQAGLGDIGADHAADGAVKRVPGHIGGFERKTDIVDGGTRHQGGQNIVADRHHLNGAGAQVGEHVRVVTQLAVGEHHQFDGTLAGFLDLCRRGHGMHGGGMVGRKVESKADDVMAGRAGGTKREAGGSGRGAGQELFAGKQRRHVRPPVCRDLRHYFHAQAT
jgi:hypothetical protein